jgi:hypothetical protein
MNYFKKFSLHLLRLNAKWMWVGLLFGFIVASGMINVGCDKKNVVDEYYVKYEVNSSSIYLGGKLNVAIRMETNNITNILVDTRTPWEAIVGPVKKGFNATLDVIKEGEPDSHLKLYAKISVSKNSSPFALKVNDGSDTPRNSVQISYTIDY